MMVDTYNLKMKGLKKVSGQTFNWRPNTGHTQINYNTRTGELLLMNHFSDHSWTCYHDDDVILVCNTRRHMTMQEIADKVKESYEESIYQSQITQ